MSVTLGREAEEAGISPLRALMRFPGFALASLAAGSCRRQHQAIERAPTDRDPHHALVNGAKPKPVQKALSRSARFLVLP
jgi:hypothetical protein